MSSGFIDTLFGASHTLDRHQQGMIYANQFSTLAVKTHDQIVANLQSKDLLEEVETFRAGDYPGGRSPFAAANQAMTGGRDDVQPLSARLADRSEVITTQAPAGTGMIMLNCIEPFRNEPLDQVTRVLITGPNPSTREAMCQRLNLAALGRGNSQHVFVSKADEQEAPHYPAALAEIQETMLYIDSLNLFDAGVAHRTIPASAVDQTRSELSSAIRRLTNQLRFNTVQQLGFDPDDWLPPGACPVSDPWAEDEFKAFVAFPREYQDTNLLKGLLSNDDEIQVLSAPAPVETIRVLLAREVSDEFLQRVKVENPRWLVDNAASFDPWLKEVRSHCGRNTDPQEAVVEFLTREMNIQDSDVLTALQEAMR